MKYNVIHQEYRLGMGLYFKLTNKHISCLGKWMCISNIPELNMKVLESENEEDASYEVMGIIQGGINYERKV